MQRAVYIVFKNVSWLLKVKLLETKTKKHKEDFHKCKQCEKTCKNKDNLEEHIRTHTNLDNFIWCERCGIYFGGQVKLLTLVPIVP